MAPLQHHGGQEAYNKEELRAALHAVGDYITKKNAHITLIAVGGAVNLLLLGTRPSTSDVDFFNQQLEPNQIKLIQAATKYARKQNPRLSDDWLNNRNTVFIPTPLRLSLTNQAIEQNEVVFKLDGLTVLAAPWHYAFIAKVDRISGSGKPYDLGDAAAYLNRYLELHSMSSIVADIPIGWAAQYNVKIAPGALRAVNEESYRRYGRRPIFQGELPF